MQLYAFVSAGYMTLLSLLKFSKVQNVKECDATSDDICTIAGYTNKKSPTRQQSFCDSEWIRNNTIKHYLSKNYKVHFIFTEKLFVVRKFYRHM